MRNFKQLKIWQKGIEIATISYQLTKDFPSNERFGLVSQMNRAAVSIPSNIAEGSGRNSSKDYLHFIQISLGSCFELETQLLIAKELNYGSRDLVVELLHQLAEEEKMLTAFGKTLKATANR